MSIMNFLIADVIQFVSGTMTTFSQGDGTKIKSDMTQISVDIYKLSTRALWITTVLSLCLERFLVGLLGMNILT